MLEAGIWLRQYERKQSDQPAAFMPITPPQYSSVPTTPYLPAGKAGTLPPTP